MNLIEQYFAAMEDANYSDATIGDGELHMNQFVDYMLQRVTQHDVDGYLAAMERSGMTEGAIRNRRATLRRFVTFLGHSKLPNIKPWQKVG